MTFITRGALAALGAAVLAGCSSDLITGGPLIRPGEPTSVIQVVNASGRYVDVVLISACSASTYGLNRLPDGYSIPPGGFYDFTVSAGCWDIDAGVVGYGEARERIQAPAGGGFRYTVQ